MKNHLLSALVLVASVLAVTQRSAYAGDTPAQRRNPRPDSAAKPADAWVKMKALGIMENRGARAVVLEDSAGKTLLPIWIGDSEAFSIQLRLNRQRFQRPLTHDLLDAMVQRLGGRLVEVRVDDLRENTFLGKVVVVQAGKRLVFDARPSDAIALAVGNQVPIMVSRRVLERAGIRKDEKQQPEPDEQEQQNLLKEILQPDQDEKTL